MVACSAHGLVSQDEKLKARIPQLSSAGPAALVPSAFAIDRLEPLSMFPKTIKPALRPMFILLPKVNPTIALYCRACCSVWRFS
jgi:hypothetical protein